MCAQFLRPVHTSLQPASKWLQPKALHVALIPKAVLSLQPASKVASTTKFACGFNSVALAALNPVHIRHIIIRSSDAIGIYVCIPRMSSKRNLSLFILVTESTWQDLH